MKDKLAKLQADIAHTKRYYQGMGIDEELSPRPVLEHLNDLVEILVDIYGKPEETDEG